MDKTKTQKALEIANELAKEAESSVDFHNAFFGVGGRFGELFPTVAERRAFAKTREYHKILDMRSDLSRLEVIIPELEISVGSFRACPRNSLPKKIGFLSLPAEQVVDGFLSTRPECNDLRDKLVARLLKSHVAENGLIRVSTSSILGERFDPTAMTSR